MASTPTSDPSVKVILKMPASIYHQLREHAHRTGSTMSRLCRDGALRALAEAGESEE